VKRYISRFLKIVAGFFLLFPLLYIFLAAILFDIPFQKGVGILFTPTYLIVAFVVALAGYGIREMQRWSWYVFIFSQVLLSAENALLLHSYAESHNKVIAYAFSLLIQGLLIYEINRELRVPYFFPKIRWWESNPRYRLSIPAVVVGKKEERIESEILDLSPLGCFAKLRMDLPQDTPVVIQFRIFNHEVNVDGAVVWLAKSAVTHPRGVGIKFLSASKDQRRALRKINRKLKKAGSLYRRYRYLLSQEEFLRRLEEIETH
jgi:PilZ domain